MSSRKIYQSIVMLLAAPTAVCVVLLAVVAQGPRAPLAKIGAESIDARTNIKACLVLNYRRCSLKVVSVMFVRTWQSCGKMCLLCPTGWWICALVMTMFANPKYNYLNTAVSLALAAQGIIILCLRRP